MAWLAAAVRRLSDRVALLEEELKSCQKRGDFQWNIDAQPFVPKYQIVLESLLTTDLDGCNEELVDRGPVGEVSSADRCLESPSTVSALSSRGAALGGRPTSGAVDKIDAVEVGQADEDESMVDSEPEGDAGEPSDDESAQLYWRRSDLPPGVFCEHLLPRLQSMPADLCDVSEGEVSRWFHGLAGTVFKELPSTMPRAVRLQMASNLSKDMLHVFLLRKGPRLFRHAYRDCRDLLASQVLETIRESLNEPVGTSAEVT